MGKAVWSARRRPSRASAVGNSSAAASRALMKAVRPPCSANTGSARSGLPAIDSPLPSDCGSVGIVGCGVGRSTVSTLCANRIVVNVGESRPRLCPAEGRKRSVRGCASSPDDDSSASSLSPLGPLGPCTRVVRGGVATMGDIARVRAWGSGAASSGKWRGARRALAERWLRPGVVGAPAPPCWGVPFAAERPREGVGSSVPRALAARTDRLVGPSCPSMANPGTGVLW